ncbi:GAF domain-containing protein [Imperialibacter roseus]|uniref:GAF domain-containing protein n=1 Tax=Imperialibacter roseus TaxID=1324217 RepID=A0ABZ0IQ44_9BACT|nr:GAF domain-containing protein [Imperialibacter roseus]WOK06485.1 GAF domain-containing protein [Imperialibacter roseus]|tara:strand:+ start:422 stop:904 length:483 start_codon:yes stop_codon:yes gene_type:complete
MAETLFIPQEATKQDKYESLVPQVEALIAGEPDLTANLANIAAALKYGMGFFWVGFYMVKEDQLVLGPFQGPIACTRINLGKGVCGSSWKEARTFIVPDVDQFPGHIACSGDSKSEIVLPIIRDGKVLGVLDVDSDRLNEFDEVDQRYLEQIIDMLQITS